MTAKTLSTAGVEVRKGDFNKPETLAAAAAGVDTAFLVGTPFEQGIQADTDHGIAAVD
ncbi:MAG: NmrA family NAD(P)-binding protein, partial [bacterium]|nr:NmrA family NAD(P)-binding protein [bacterium]